MTLAVWGVIFLLVESNSGNGRLCVQHANAVRALGYALALARKLNQDRDYADFKVHTRIALTGLVGQATWQAPQPVHLFRSMAG